MISSFLMSRCKLILAQLCSSYCMTIKSAIELFKNKFLTLLTPWLVSFRSVPFCILAQPILSIERGKLSPNVESLDFFHYKCACTARLWVVSILVVDLGGRNIQPAQWIVLLKVAYFLACPYLPCLFCSLMRVIWSTG